MKTVWDDLYDEEWLASMNAKLREAQKYADRQAFGMLRQANTDEFVRNLTEVKVQIERLLARVK